jgi:hypothetical protein
MDETQLPDDLLKYIDETIDEYTGKLKKLEENCDIAVKATLSEVKQSHLELQENHDRVHGTRIN